MSQNPVSTSTPTPEPQPGAKRTIYAVNHGFSVILTDASNINTAAASAEFAPILSKRAITPAFIAEQNADIARATTLMQTARSGRNSRTNATSTRTAKRDALDVQIGIIQGAALQRDVMEGGDRARNYFVGSDAGGADDPELKSIAGGIIEQLSHDDLPGIDQAQEDALEAAFEAWEAEAETQSSAGRGAGAAQDELEPLIERIKRRRQATQLAADSAFPYQLPENAAKRAAFELRANRPYRPGVKKVPLGA